METCCKPTPFTIETPPPVTMETTTKSGYHGDGNPLLLPWRPALRPPPVTMETPTPSVVECRMRGWCSGGPEMHQCIQSQYRHLTTTWLARRGDVVIGVNREAVILCLYQTNDGCKLFLMSCFCGLSLLSDVHDPAPPWPLLAGWGFIDDGGGVNYIFLMFQSLR